MTGLEQIKLSLNIKKLGLDSSGLGKLDGEIKNSVL